VIAGAKIGIFCTFASKHRKFIEKNRYRIVNTLISNAEKKPHSGTFSGKRALGDHFTKPRSSTTF
jgi:hypothetical protein